MLLPYVGPSRADLERWMANDRARGDAAGRRAGFFGGAADALAGVFDGLLPNGDGIRGWAGPGYGANQNSWQYAGTNFATGFAPNPLRPLHTANDLYDAYTDPCPPSLATLANLPVPGLPRRLPGRGGAGVPTPPVRQPPRAAPPKAPQPPAAPKSPDKSSPVVEPTTASCFVAGTDVLEGDGDRVDIEAVDVGDRLATDGGASNGGTLVSDPSATEVDPRTWRKVTIEAVYRWDDGTRDVWAVETLKPAGWLRTHGGRDGTLALNTLLDLDEMGGVPDGLTGRVTAVDRCPRIEDGPGRVVLTTVNHLNPDVYDLTVRAASGAVETLGVTGSHRFYDKADGWQATRDLAAGDALRGLAGGAVTVVAAAPRAAAATRVYNLTVEADHVYYVGDLSALTHNNYDDPPDKGGKFSQRKPGNFGKFKGSDALRAENKTARDAAKAAGLDKDQARRLHDEISGQGYSYQEILEIAKDIAKGG